MFSPGSKNPPRIVISWLLLTVLNEQGGLGKVVGNLAPGHLVNGTLGQSVTLPVNIPQTELQSITWDFRNGNNGKKIQVCSKFVHNPEKCNNELGEKFRLNLNDYSLEIQTLIKSDQGLYEVNARTEQGVHEETVELRVYEGVSSPRIQISDVSSDRICNVTLSCSVESGSDLIYSWWRGDGDITADWSHRVTDNGSRLEVSLNPHDTSTVFNCTVRNPVSEKTWSVDLAHSCNITTGGDKEHKGPVLHKGIIAAITVVVILLVIGIVYAYRRKQSKPDEAPNTEGTSEQAQYAEIRKSSNARDQPVSPLSKLRPSCSAQHPQPRTQRDKLLPASVNAALKLLQVVPGIDSPIYLLPSFPLRNCLTVSPQGRSAIKSQQVEKRRLELRSNSCMTHQTNLENGSLNQNNSGCTMRGLKYSLTNCNPVGKAALIMTVL